MRAARWLWVVTVLAAGCGEDSMQRDVDAGTSIEEVDAATCQPFEDPAETSGQDCENGSSPGPTGPATEVVQGEGGYEVHRNLTYRMISARVLQGDLWLPPIDPEARPGAILMVHGGGWQDCQRRRDAIDSVALAYSLLGIPIFNIEYRLADEGGEHPRAVRDVACAYQWLAAHGDQYGYDPTRLAIMGESAGAHLTLMAGLIGDRDDIDPACGDWVEPALLVSMSAPTDLPQLAIDKADIELDATVSNYAGASCDEAVSGCEAGRACHPCVDASPLAHACHVDTPIALVHAPDPWDPLIPLSQADAMALALAEADSDTLRIVPSAETLETTEGCEGGVAHGFVCLPGAVADVLNPVLVGVVGPAPAE